MPHSSKADTSAMDELNLDELFGNGDTGKSIFDDEDLIEIGDEIIGNSTFGDALTPKEFKGSALSADIASPRNNKRKGTLTSKVKVTKTKIKGEHKSSSSVDELGERRLKKKTKKKKEKALLVADCLDDRAPDSSANRYSLLSKIKPLPQCSLSSSDMPVTEASVKVIVEEPAMPPSVTTMYDSKIKVSARTMKKDSKKKKKSAAQDLIPAGGPSIGLDDTAQSGSIPVSTSSLQHAPSSWQNQQQKTHRQLQNTTSSRFPEHTSPKESTEKLEVSKKQEQPLNDILRSNKEYFPFIEIPSKISLASRKFSKSYPKLDTIYNALAGVKGTQTQTLSTDSSISNSAGHHSFDIYKAKDELSTIDQKVLAKELQEALSMLRMQTSFLHQTKENIQSWCKTNFYDEDYNDLYPNATIAFFPGRDVSLTTVAVTDSAATNPIVEKSTTDVTTATTKPEALITPPTLPSIPPMLPEKEIPALSTRQTLREKFKSITTTQAINVRIKCSAFKPPFALNEKTQKKEVMKLVALIIPETVSIDISLTKPSAVSTRKQPNLLKHPRRQNVAVYDLRALITSLAQVAKNLHAKRIQNVSEVFQEMITELEEKVESEETVSTFTMWRMLESSYYTLDTFGGSCTAKKKNLIRFALNDVWQPEIPLRIGWKEPPVVQLYCYKGKRNVDATGINTDFTGRKRKKNFENSVQVDYNMKPEEPTSNGVLTKSAAANFTDGQMQLDKSTSKTHEGFHNGMHNIPVVDVEMAFSPVQIVHKHSTVEEVIPAEVSDLTLSDKNVEFVKPSGYRRMMPSVFDRLQSLLVEVDGWSDEEGCGDNTEIDVESYIFEEIEVDDASSKNSLVHNPKLLKMLDLSQLTLDQRTYIQLRAARLIDIPFLPDTSPMVEESEWKSDEGSDHLLLNEQLADKVTYLQHELSYLHRSNNETAAFLQHEALTHLSFLENNSKIREEQAAICAKHSQILLRRRKEAKQRSKASIASTKKNSFDSLPW